MRNEKYFLYYFLIEKYDNFRRSVKYSADAKKSFHNEWLLIWMWHIRAYVGTSYFLDLEFCVKSVPLSTPPPFFIIIFSGLRVL